MQDHPLSSQGVLYRSILGIGHWLVSYGMAGCTAGCLAFNMFYTLALNLVTATGDMLV